jgi:predicted dehydrogenase
MVEKPMAPTVADADRLIAAARQAGRYLTVNHNYRNMPAFVQMREVIASGVLGRIIQLRMAWHGFYRRWDWQTLREYGGGMLANYGSHGVDRALLFMPDVEPEVFCHMETTPLWAGDAEGHVKIILRAPGLPLIDLEMTCACAFPQDDWLVMGTQGGLTGSQRGLRWRYYDPTEAQPRPLDPRPTPDRSYNHEELLWHEESYIPTGEDPWGYRKIWLDFYRTLRQGASLAITPESVRREIAVLDACRSTIPAKLGAP